MDEKPVNPEAVKALFRKVYELHLEGHNDAEIAKRIGISEDHVTKLLGDYMFKDYEIAQGTISQFIQSCTNAHDFFQKKKAELSDMIPKDNKEKLQIISLQADLETKALSLARQEQLVEVLKNIQSGKLKLNSEALGELTNES